MSLRKRTDPVTLETLFEGRAASGLALRLLPRPTLARTAAQLTVSFGAIHRRFKVRGRRGVLESPAGVAHFLEHKMFEKERGDLFPEFSALGASANAMTGHGATSYVFSASASIAECLDLLLELVFDPWFRDELVEKERGIIDEEIRGYDDSAGWRAYRATLEGLYRKHPVREDIAGTTASIREIDAKLLTSIHDAFYTPTNAVLTMAGKLEPAAILEQVDRRLPRRGRTQAEPVMPKEPQSIQTRSHAFPMPVALPILYVGFKGPPPPTGLPGLKFETGISSALDVWFGETSEWREEHYAAGTLGDDFSYGVRVEDGYSYVVFGGQTPDPQSLERAIRDRLHGPVPSLPADEWERRQRRSLGDYVRMFDGAEGVCGFLADCHFAKVDPFAYPAVVAATTRRTARGAALRVLDPRRTTTVRVVPGKPGG